MEDLGSEPGNNLNYIYSFNMNEYLKVIFNKIYACSINPKFDAFFTSNFQTNNPD